MTFHIRSATKEDTESWVRMRESLWPDYDGVWHAIEVDKYFAGKLSMPLEVLIAVDESGRAMGFAELSIRAYAEGCLTERVAYLEGWYVEPDARRRGRRSRARRRGRALGTSARLHRVRIRCRARQPR